jgi:hypothetical protein
MSKEEAEKIAELGEKPGWKTTEFWLAVLSYIVGILLASGAFGDGDVAQALGIAQMVLGKLGYDWTRKGVKSSASHAKALLMAAAANPPTMTVTAPIMDPTPESTPD